VTNLYGSLTSPCQNREPSTTDTGLSKWANGAYVGDLSLDFAGLQQAVDRTVAKAHHVPAPFAELTGDAYLEEARPEEEVFYRRLHFGALQPVMAHTPHANSDPWFYDADARRLIIKVVP
jgi:hypothetical protein